MQEQPIIRATVTNLDKIEGETGNLLRCNWELESLLGLPTEILGTRLRLMIAYNRIWLTRVHTNVNYSPLILSIETSLDDTCAAVVSGYRVLSNVVASQVAFHEEWGGTVPDIAKRMHLKWIDGVVDVAIKNSKTQFNQLNAIAVTVGPGLAPSLEVGIDKAKSLANKYHLPLIAVNHLEGHLLSSLSLNSTGTKGLNLKDLKFPALGFLISGGHTELVLVNSIGDYQLLGQTLDDAAGEAYDKVARMLKLGYPGGPILSELAKSGQPIYHLPIPMTQRHDLNFSFSGLKTAAMNLLTKLVDVPHDKQFLENFAASFEAAALKHLLHRFKKAVEIYQPQSILLGGGVVSNLAIRSGVRKIAQSNHLPTHIPFHKKIYTDNAAMIGIVAVHKYIDQDFAIDQSSLDRMPNLNFPLKTD